MGNYTKQDIIQLVEEKDVQFILLITSTSTIPQSVTQ